MIDLKPGDPFCVRYPSLLAPVTSLFEKKDPGADPLYTHSGVITDSKGAIIESVWKVRLANLKEYAGCPIIIGRFRGMDNDRFNAGLVRILPHLGETYPVYRLVLSALGIARLVHGWKDECSELVAEFLGAATGIKEFQNQFGWTPAGLADVIERWSTFEMVFKGVLST